MWLGLFASSSLYVHFQIRTNSLYGETPIQTKTKEHVTARYKNHSFENSKWQSVSNQTAARQSITHAIQFAERNHSTILMAIS